MEIKLIHILKHFTNYILPSINMVTVENPNICLSALHLDIYS